MSEKTNALRLLDQHHIAYSTTAYEVKDGFIDGVSVAEKVGKQNHEVYKTLVTQGATKAYYVFVIAVDQELDLKKAAKAAHEKHIEMIPAKDLTKITGYLKGGCSPLGMKKQFMTFFDSDVAELAAVTMSAGKIGLQMTVGPTPLIALIKAQLVDLKKD
jgi:Cys-tRNA(Pro)/Cys-tRNA(Cys) deacylase